MDQLTIRGIDDDLSACLRGLAEREGISLSHAALKLLRKGAGLTDERKPTGTVGNSLDDLFGTWTEAEADEFDRALQVFETVDEEAWR